PRFDDSPTGSGPAATPVGPAKLFIDGADRCALCFSIRQVVRAAATTLGRAVGGAGLAAVRAATKRPLHRGRDGLLHVGILFWQQEALDAAVMEAGRRGFQVAQHAIGNEAISVALTAIERAGSTLDEPPGRPRLEQAIGVDEVLQAYTRGGAAALGIEQQAGTIEPGKQADLVVLSADPVRTDPDRIDDLAILRTYVAGQLAYEA